MVHVFCTDLLKLKVQTAIHKTYISFNNEALTLWFASCDVTDSTDEQVLATNWAIC